MEPVRNLWNGTLPLGQAFWTWAVTGGLAVNISTSVLFLTLVAQDRVWLALLAGYGLSLPYNLLALVGVWRAAGRYDGPQGHAALARAVSAVLLAMLSLT